MELKPCPFCGSNILVKTRCNAWPTPYYQIRCDKCGANITGYPLKEAKAAWNRRAALPNAPLTLDELRQMDGEPVWIDISSSRSCWAIVKNYDEQHNMIKFSGFGGLSCDIYGKYWLAWRRRPEECGDIDNCLDMLEDVELALRRTEKIIAKEEEP